MVLMVMTHLQSQHRHAASDRAVVEFYVLNFSCLGPEAEGALSARIGAVGHSHVLHRRACGLLIEPVIPIPFQANAIVVYREIAPAHHHVLATIDVDTVRARPFAIRASLHPLRALTVPRIGLNLSAARMIL